MRVNPGCAHHVRPPHGWPTPLLGPRPDYFNLLLIVICSWVVPRAAPP
jgi:hypothetical protein